jgi:hypothetical protein
LDDRTTLALVTKTLSDEDPLALISATGANADEYDAEARMIANRLKSCQSFEACRRMIWEVFVTQFGDGVGSENTFSELARSIWDRTRA